MPSLSACDANQVLYSFYETATGIFNHQDVARKKLRPLASVALHEAEENTQTSALYEQMRVFIENDIHTLTGYTMDQFFNLPREFFYEILRECGKKVAKANADAGKVAKQAETVFGPPRG